MIRLTNEVGVLRGGKGIILSIYKMEVLCFQVYFDSINIISYFLISPLSFLRSGKRLLGFVNTTSSASGILFEYINFLKRFVCVNYSIMHRACFPNIIIVKSKTLSSCFLDRNLGLLVSVSI